MPKISFPLLATLLAAQLAAAQAPELVTDRPDFTESPLAVPIGSVQLEVGSTWERSGGINTLNAAEALIRWGMWPAFELRLGLPDFVTSEGVSGATDASVGGKLALGRAGGWDVGLVMDLSLPIGDADYGTDGTVANLIVAAGRDLGERWSLGTQLATQWASEPDEVTLAYSAVLGVGLSERVSSFAEVASSPVEEAPRAVLLHHGYTVLVASTLQVDIHGGVGLSEAAADGFVGIGFATRFGR